MFDIFINGRIGEDIDQSLKKPKHHLFLISGNIFTVPTTHHFVI